MKVYKHFNDTKMKVFFCPKCDAIIFDVGIEKSQAVRYNFN